MEEAFQVTFAWKQVSGEQIALIKDARLNGVSTAACIGHLAPQTRAARPDLAPFRGTRRHQALVGGGADGAAASSIPDRILAPLEAGRKVADTQ